MPRYMVHKHDATRAGLHWDLRLEQNGVLKSWAIPKGMPRKSGVRHLAIQTPDHDLSYGKWEGTIPEGSYGAGKVTIDASGEYQTIEQTKKKWKFQCLTGKYKGTWTLIHWKNKQWLITKSADLKQTLSYSAEGPFDSCDFCGDQMNVSPCITDWEKWNPKNCGKLVCDECQVQLLSPVNPQSGKSYWVAGFCPICAQEEVSSGEMFNAEVDEPEEQLDSSAAFCFPCEVKTNTIKGSCVICNQWKPNCPTCGSIGKPMLDKDRCVVCDRIHWDQLFGEADHMAFRLDKLKERYNLPDEGDFRRAEDEEAKVGQKGEPDKQVELAIKRTQLSVIRTGLALTTFGVVLWNLWMNKKQAGQIESILDSV